jgi:hypothetical protein
MPHSLGAASQIAVDVNLVPVSAWAFIARTPSL